MRGVIAATGVELAIEDETDDVIDLVAQVWLDLDRGASEPERWYGSVGPADSVAPASGDPTSVLVAAAHEFRNLSLGNLLGDIRIAGYDATRWECYSAPFHIDLDDALRRRLAGSWDPRDPR